MDDNNLGLADTMSGVTGLVKDGVQNVDENFSSTIKGIAHKDPEQQQVKSELPAGTVLGDRYTIVRVVGKGGFGVVYEATDSREYNKRVAIKTLKHNLDDYELAKKRFQREIETCSSITSPHAVKIFDNGVAPDESLYYVMEFLDGTSLDDHLGRREKFSFVDTKKILIQALEALGEAHRLNIVHRDIKPANICLMARDEGSRDYDVKVLDFGIAKVIAGEDQPGGEKLTQTGAWMGSPQYMSPEHLKGGVVTPASDVFAIGLMAIEMLTGYPAAEGESPMDVAMFILSQNDIFIDDWILESSIGSILARCVKKDPTSRYKDANELREALEELNDSELINEYNALKISGKLGRRRTTMRSDTMPAGTGIPTTSGLTVEDRRNMSIQMLLIIGIAFVVLLIIVGILIKLAIPDEVEMSEQPVHVKALVSSAIHGHNVGAYEPARLKVLVASTPEGATVYRASDMAELGRTPLQVEPYMIPYSANAIPWTIILKAEDCEDYKLSIVPKITASALRPTSGSAPAP